MRLYSGKVSAIATEVVRALLASNDIEAESAQRGRGRHRGRPQPVPRRRARRERAREGRPRAHGQAAERTSSACAQLVADEKGIKVGDETLDYLLDQVVEMLMHSGNVDEVYVEDVELRRKMAPLFKKHMAVDTALDAEVRAQLKHVREGTREWEIEYAPGARAGEAPQGA